MFNRPKLLSVLLAGVLSVSSLFAAAPAAFAADDDDDKPEMTFDGRHLMDEIVSINDYFDTENDDESREKLEKALVKAAGVRELDDITFDDLAKVKTLDLSDLDLVDVPFCINYMVNMTRLDLSSNLLQSDALKKLSLTGCTKLSTINLSDNYLTTMPSWFMSDRVTSGNITKNFVDSTNPRSIKSLFPTYYLMDGETFNEDDLKNQILKSIRLNDGKLLPEVFFDYNATSGPYPKDASRGYPYALDIVEPWVSFTADGKIVAPQNKTIEVTVRLFNEENNDNTKTIVTIYLLSGEDLPALKLRLDGMVKECDALKKVDYTENSWTKFTQAKDTAKAILKYEKADAQMLSSALNALSSARDHLDIGITELKAMLTGLESVGKTYKKDDYTPSSWERFNNALERIREVLKDKNAKLEDAQKAAKSFQSAQAGLTSAELSVPEKILKSQFEEIFGENKEIGASGITAEGTRYKWTFNGRDLERIADFSPEVKVTDAAEPNILIEAGSKSGYKLFATAAKGAFPGKGTLELNVSDKFKSGSFYLYKWDSSKKRSVMAGSAPVTVANGIAKIPVSEGGVYYLCRTIQNFELESSRYEVDPTAKKVTVPLTTSGVRVSSFKNTFTFGGYTTVLDKDGNPVPSGELIKTGMTINSPNMDNHKIVLVGDCNGDGTVKLNDMIMALDSFISETVAAETEVYDVNGSNKFELSDLIMLLDFYMAS